jgi:hypothetical protein
MSVRDKFISNMLDNLLSDTQMLVFLEKNTNKIPTLNYEEYIHLMEYNCWNSLIFLVENNKIMLDYKDRDNQNLMLISALKYDFSHELSYLNFIKTLNENGVNINEKNFLSQNLFLILLNNKKSHKLTIHLIEKLENLGLNIIDENNQHYSLGSSIAQFANKEIFDYLYPRCNPHFEDLDGNNMLLNACSNSDISILKFLIHEGLQDKVNLEGKNACNIALDYREINNYQFLIETKFSHPNQVASDELISFVQSFNVFYMLKNLGDENQANAWLDYYLSTININLLSPEKIEKLQETYFHFNAMDDFFEKSFIFHEKKTLENTSFQMPHNLNIKENQKFKI